MNKNHCIVYREVVHTTTFEGVTISKIHYETVAVVKKEIIEETLQSLRKGLPSSKWGYEMVEFWEKAP